MEKNKPAYTTIDEYIAQCPAETHETLHTLRQTIRETAPEATEKISWGMATFSLKGDLVHFALAKKHIGFFPGASGVEAFMERLGDFETSKGTIRLPLNKPLPLPLVRDIVTFRVEENKRLSREREARKAAKLESLPNMGKVLAGNLRAIGIQSPAQLREMGTEEAFLRIRAMADSGACIQMLYGLDGAVQGVRDTLLSQERKEELRAFFKKLG